MTIIIQVTGTLYGRYTVNIYYCCFASMNCVNYFC